MFRFNNCVRTSGLIRQSKRMYYLDKIAERLHNPYFSLNSGQKDIWTLINETAAKTQNETKKSIVNLGQGFFSYNPPDFALEALRHDVGFPQYNQYAPAKGNPHLIKALAKKYSLEFGRPVAENELQISTGANEGIFSVFFGFLSPGDEVIVFQPFFDQYISNIEMCGAKVKYGNLKYPEAFDSKNVTGKDWEVDWEGLEGLITEKTKLIVLNTPHNPIGKVFTAEELHRLGELVIKHDLLLLSDEVYENLYYTGEFPRPAALASLPELSQRTLTAGSIGKSFAATGWRVGWVHGPADLIKYVNAAHTRICFSSPAPLQQAAADSLQMAFDSDYFANTRKEYVKKYEIFSKVFDDLGLPYTVAEGGYFFLVNLLKLLIPEDYNFPPEIASRKTLDFKLAYWLIREIGVVGIPPTEFLQESDKTKSGLEKCLRFAVCKDDSMLETAVSQLKELKNYL